MFKPYFSEWLVRQYFAGWWLLGLGLGLGLAVAVYFLLQ